MSIPYNPKTCCMALHKDIVSAVLIIFGAFLIVCYLRTVGLTPPLLCVPFHVSLNNHTQLETTLKKSVRRYFLCRTTILKIYMFPLPKAIAHFNKHSSASGSVGTKQ